MARFLFRASPARKISLLLTIFLASSLLVSPALLAQRPVGHPTAPTGRPAAPPLIPPPIAHPAFAGPRATPIPRGSAFGGPDFGNAGRSIYILRHPFFRPGPFAFWGDLWFASYAWLTCGPFWGWDAGCGGVPPFLYGAQAYAPPPVYQPPVYVYVYGSGRNDLVELYLKDGSVFSVADYWFVNNEVHFTVPEGAPGKPGEQVIPIEELDLQRTIDVNTKRGFRFVMRNEPWQQYLRDHPDVTPPTVAPPPKN